MIRKNYQTTTWLRLLTVALFLFQGVFGLAQTTNYFARATGNWNAGNSWSTVSCVGTAGTSAPSTTNHIVNISCGTTTTVGSTVGAGALIISSGTLVVNSGVTLTVTSLTMTGGTLTVNGTLNITSGGTGVVSITNGTVNGTGTVGLTGGLQNLSSTKPFYNLNIAGSGNKTMLTDITVTNQLTLTTNNLLVSDKTLTVGSSTTGSGIVRTSGKLTLSNTSSLSLGGSWNNTDLSPFISNSWPVTINNFTMTRNLCKVGLGTAHNLTVNGSFTLTAGDFSIGASALTLNGPITGNINGSIIGGSSSDLTIGGSGAASMYFDLGSFDSVGGSNTIRNFTNNRTSNPFIMLSSLRIGGALTTAAAASLQISNGSFQTLTLDGTVSGTARLIGNSAAVLTIAGSGALGGTIAFASSPVLGTLNMDRLSGTATLGSAVSTGGLSLKRGVLTNAFLTTVTGSAPSNVQQTLSSSYLAGALARTIAANTNAAAYIWPIGKAATQKLAFNGITTGASGDVVVTAEAFDGNSNGSIGTSMESLNTDNYWSASVTSGAANLLTLGSLSLNDSGLSAQSVIGYASTQSGIYTSLGGTVAAPTVTSTETVPMALGFFNLGSGQPVCTDASTPTASASSTTNCGTAATTLSIASGSLNSATEWVWYRDACGENTVGSGTSISVSPSVTTTYYVRGEGGCTTAGACGSITITVNIPQLYYSDADGDTYGNAAMSQLACAQPVGYVTNASDCDDTDNSIYRTGNFYIDSDGDGYTAGQADVCYGATTPSGYAAASLGADCDDQQAMVNPSRPEILYNGVDDNCDGNFDEQSPLTTTLLASVCNTTLPAIGSIIGITTVGGHPITAYRVRATNGTQVQVIERYVGHFTLTQFPSFTYATTYTIDIELQRNGIWLGYYGATCQVSTPAILAEGGSASVSPLQCGITLPRINSLIATTSIAQVTGYRFRVTNLTDAVGPNAVQTTDRGVNWFTLPMLSRYNYGTTYRIEVAVKTTGGYGGFGSPCEISSPAPPSLLNCNTTIATGNTLIAATSVAGALQYRFQIVRASDLAAATIDRSANYFTFNALPLAVYTPNALYYIRVAVMTSGSWSDFGDVCEVTSPAAVGKPAAEATAMATTDFKAVAAPNPFSGSFGIEATAMGTENVSMKVYDMLGRLLESAEVKASDLAALKMGTHYPSGVYNVIVSQGAAVKTLRVMKR